MCIYFNPDSLVPLVSCASSTLPTGGLFCASSSMPAWGAPPDLYTTISTACFEAQRTHCRNLACSSSGHPMQILDEFVEAVMSRWPKTVLQFEDFQLQYAHTLLQRYKHQHLVFNDDIQVRAYVCMHASVCMRVCACMCVHGCECRHGVLRCFEVGRGVVYTGQEGGIRWRTKRAETALDNCALLYGS